MRKILILIITTVFSLNCEIKIYKSKFMNWDSMVIDNGLIRVSILPEIGGRIVEYYNYQTGHNLIRIAPWFLEIPPDKLLQTGEYGGISDIGSLGWPGYFWDKRYEFDIKREKDKVEIIGVSRSEGIYIERRMEIRENSTKLKFNIMEKNISKDIQNMVIRLHGEFKVGEIADENDVYYWVYENKLKERRYKPSDLVRFSIDKNTEGWSGIVDEREEEALIRRYYPMKGVHKTFWWAGFLEGDPELKERDDRGGFYNFERYPDPVKIKPEEKIEGEEDLFTIVGLKRINYVNEDIAFGFWLPKKLIGEEGFFINLGIGSPEEINKEYKIEVSLRKDENTLAKKEIKITKFIPGKFVKENIFFDTKNISDGKYNIQISIYKDNEQLKNFTEKIEINKGVVKGAEDLIKLEENYISKISKKKGYPYQEMQKLLIFLVKQQKEDFQNGLYEEIKKRHERFMNYFKSCPF
jgi:hypothetical protein